MTANELELTSDRLAQAKDRVQMQDDDLQGYMERRRELRDRMKNVSTVVRDWRSKIRNASSSILLAQNSISKNYARSTKSLGVAGVPEKKTKWLSRDLERTYNYSRGEFEKILPM